MKIENKVMLITYPDSLGNDFKELSMIPDKHLNGVIGGIHLLPFFLLLEVEALPQSTTQWLILPLEDGKR